MSGFTLVVSGDTILNHRASVCRHPGFLAVVDLLRGADVTHTQFEQIIHDFEGPEIYPSAEGAWSWFRAPRAAADELRWLGVDLVSTASNHSLDYSYGALRTTWAALDAAGIPHTGTGADLAAARAPAFLDSPHGRVALVSACSSFPMFGRAGAARPDLQGRPGVNPLRHFHRVDRTTADEVVELAGLLGHWVTRVGDELTVNPPGMHNTLWRFRVSDEPGVTTLPDEDDLAGNLAAIRHALAQADFVIAHLHAHEWDAGDGSIATSAAFVETYARAAVDEGAHVVIVQGSHAPMRGIEVYKGRVIFYDPGDLHRNGRVDKHPADFYLRWGYGPQARVQDAGPHDGYAGREAVFGWREGAEDVVRSPRTTYSDLPGFFLPVCHVADDFRVESVDIHPLVVLSGHRADAGLPALATAADADTVLTHLESLCEPYGTRLERRGDTARLEVA